MLSWLLTVCVVLSALGAKDAEDIVRIGEGLLRGSTMTSLHGRHFRTYRGIPYAEPPTGFRRFKPPEPVAPWSGVRNATAEGSVCPQRKLTTEEYVGNEDCLFLNVYAHRNARRHPVIVWVHGGAFIEGHGGVTLAGPYYLMDHDVVVVTFNYRLGPLGFLSTGDSALPGNYGLKDAVEVLRWVHRNIEAFGGDPQLVTVFGYSSGGASAHYLTLSPLSEGLFHRVIFESGSALHKWGFKPSPITVARKVAELLYCPATETSAGIAECLATEPAERIVGTLYNFPYWAVKMPLPYGPVVEVQEDESDPPFLREPPETLVRKGLVHKVPAITGMTAAESIDTPYLITQSDVLANQLDEYFDKIVLRDFIRGNISDAVVDKVKKFYFGGTSAKEATLQQLIALFSDSIFNYNGYSTAVAHAKATGMPVYVYLFSFEGRLSQIVREGIHPTPLGVAHADDMFYVFWRGVDFPEGAPNAEETVTIARVTKMLVDFALTGDPTPHTSDLIPVKWRPLQGGKGAFRYLDIGLELRLHQGPFFPERIAFWESILEDNMKDEL